ncbi:hypothetical protein AVEN_270359-1 [Araneus ventricosus]|uniref:Uncharacterized protein n=1 Tax=Araneus ventricosus TaxID=182803 RepID=A0A4Y2MIB7_ARAVE|nr:hypothetical protein AVEN_270359-1 [Araneus ventricosus]
MPLLCRPRTSYTDDNFPKVERFFKEDCRIKVREIAEVTGIRKRNKMREIICVLNFHKVSDRCKTPFLSSSSNLTNSSTMKGCVETSVTREKCLNVYGDCVEK